MSEPANAIDALLEVVEGFRRTELDFMVVGGFAVMAHGRPRTTADIDVSIHLSFDRRDEVRPLLEEIGEGPIEERTDPEWGKRLVTVHATGLAIEVFFTAGHPLYEREFARSVEVSVEGQPIPFVSPEDLILRKLVNMKKRRGEDWEDARSVARVQGKNLDVAYLREHCATHRVCERVEQIAELADATPE